MKITTEKSSWKIVGSQNNNNTKRKFQFYVEWLCLNEKNNNNKIKH